MPPVRRERDSRDLSWLTGPRGLALAGGVVTLMGIVFVFALAASKGWIGPAVRCSIGGGVSVLLVGSALIVRRSLGHVIAALAAAGAGIGGCYVTLYAASRGYHLLGAGFVWMAVVAVAVLAVTLALAWSSELLAVLGLVAVVIAPPTVQGHLTGLGLGASAVATAAALGIGQHRRWRLLGGLAYASMLLQTAFYVGDDKHRGVAGLLACVVFGLALVGAAAYQRHHERVDAFATGLASVSLPLALLSIWSLIHATDSRGTALLVLAGAYAAPAGALWFSERTRILAEVLGAFALFAVALATAAYLSKSGLLTAWTLEAVAFTALAVRLRQPRYQVVGAAYFAAAAVHLFRLETPVSHLLTARPHPAQHITGLLLLAAALAAAALLVRGRESLVPRLDLKVAGASALLGLYAASLELMELAQRLGGADLHAKFQRGETLVSALWALVALALLAGGLWRRSTELRYGGLALLGLALAKLFLFDLAQLSSLTRAASFLAVGLALLIGGFLVQRLADRDGHGPAPQV